MGAVDLGQICAQLEALGKSEELEGAAELLAQAETLYPQVTAALQAVRREVMDGEFNLREDDHAS